jgi:septal ring factor EnvC (AmiA/AmiB activator)
VILAAVVVAISPFITTDLSDIERLDKAITSTQETIKGLTREIEQVQGQSTMAEAEVLSARMRYDQAFAVYKERVRAVAREPRGSLLVLLGESDSLTDLLRATKILRRVAMHDRAIQQALDDETEKLRAAEHEADDDRKALDRVVGQIRATRDKLADQRRAKISAIEDALEDPARRAAMQRELTQAKSNLAAMLARMEPTPTTKFTKGTLAWPVLGAVHSKFGEAIDKHMGTQRDGIIIKAVVGDPVQAPARGRVAFAGWMRGYGQMVLLDHGDHYFTVCAQLGELDVHEGEDVKAGQALGTVGESGSTTTPGLAFEVRKQGVALDPLPWLKR